MGIIVSFALGIIYCLCMAFASITTNELQSAQDQCKVNDGVSKIVMDVIGPGNVYCNNGAKLRLKDSK